MKLHGAVIREQGVDFAVVIVRKSVVDHRHSAQQALNSFMPVFSGIPVVLMAQDHRGIPKYFGRDDLVRFLARVPLNAIPWREYSVH